MSVRFWKQLLVALRRLSPGSIEREANRPFSLAVVGSPAEVEEWTERLNPASQSPRKREQGLRWLFPISLPLSESYARMLPRYDLVLAAPSASRSVRALVRDYIPLPAEDDEKNGRWAAAVMHEVEERKPDLRLTLARHYWPLRVAAVEQIIAGVARENAAFSIASALPNVVPTALLPAWAAGEFLSDTVFITGNQFRMAFLIAAASDSAVGWTAQKAQLGSIFGSAFGWRAIARELSGKLPGGAGLVAKGLIAYAGTYAVGYGLDFLHRFGRHLTRAEKRQAYQQAYRNGRQAVEEVARKLTGRSGTGRAPTRATWT